MKVSIALESTSACINKDSNVSVVSMVIGGYSNVSQISRILMVLL